jgi:peptidoglycan/xylan/chitin deacetylase (PgdA/CDA1 family)
VPIISLEYHDVVPEGRWDDSGFLGQAAASYKLSTDLFQQHLDALAGGGSLIGASVHRALAESGDSVLFTFDDGGASAKVTAAILEERGWCAHLFITTDQIGQPGFLKRDQLKELTKLHVVGSHSASHPTRMSRLTDAQLREEWDRSVGVLQDVSGQRVSVASVPGGYYSRRVAEAALSAGVEVLFTSEPVTGIERVGACSVLGRFTLRQHHGPAYVKQLVGKSPMARGTQWVQWNLKKAGKQLAGDTYLRVRDALLERRHSR